MLLAQLKLELDHLEIRVDEADALIEKTACENEACQRLVAIPGIGPVTATAVIAAIGNGGAFRKGREFAAWMGVVPREHSTGGKQKLLGISKRGNSYLRRLFVQGARAVMQQRTKQSSGLSRWLVQLTSRTQRNVAGVALANKMARMAWAVLAKNEQYRPRYRLTLRRPSDHCEEYDFSSGLLANEEMAQRSNAALSKPATGRSLSRLNN
jgi:transposase